jgi:hypothetical protein
MDQDKHNVVRGNSVMDVSVSEHQMMQCVVHTTVHRSMMQTIMVMQLQQRHQDYVYKEQSQILGIIQQHMHDHGRVYELNDEKMINVLLLNVDVGMVL